MNLRVRWTIIYGIISFIVFFVMTYILNGMILGFFWIGVFGDNPWPSWVYFIPWLTVVISFILWVVTIVFGYRYGVKLESENKEESPRNTNKWLIISMVLLILFVSVLSLRAYSTNKQVEKIRSEGLIYDQLYRIDNLAVTNKDDNMIINVSINGSYSSTYNFLIELKSSYLGQFHYVINPIFIKSELRNQQIQFVIPYSDINKAYFEKLKTKADLSQPLLLDNLITVVVQMENNVPLDSSYHAVVKTSKRYSEMFSISCDRISCNVVSKTL